ncbi:hypothetical protein LTR40_008004, partial [Exophiala xenobiotica]
RRLQFLYWLQTLLIFTPLCVASSFLFCDRTVICHNEQSLAVTIGIYGGFTAWTGGLVINNLFNENQIMDSEYREWARSTVSILWAYGCGILYTGVFPLIHEKCTTSTNSVESPNIHGVLLNCKGCLDGFRI